MKLKFCYSLVKVLAFVTLITIAPQNKVEASTMWPGYKINSKLSIPELGLNDNIYIIDYKQSDVNGDKRKDDVLLVGEKENNAEDPYSADIAIVIKDGKTDTYSKVEPGIITVGFNSKLFLGDFNKDSIDDIFVSIGNDMELRSSTFSLITLAQNNQCKLFEQETFLKGTYFNFFYKDNFKVDIYNKDINKSFLVDLRPYKDYYIENKIYNEKGRLLKEPNGICSSIAELVPVDIDKDGAYELKGMQSLLCQKELKAIARGETIWKFRKDKFSIEAVNVVSQKN